MKTIILFGLTLLSIHLFAQLPTSYDLRNYSLVSPVKDQGSCGSCWAFASCSAIESAWLKQGNPSIDFSEDNLIDCHNFNESPCNGGSFYMTQALLSMHQGLLTEAQDPYSPSLQNCPMGTAFPPAVSVHIEEMVFIQNNIDSVKQAIMNFGAVATTMFMNYSDNNVWDAVNYKYYDSNISSSDSAYAHCVTIVGWDDSYTFPGAPSTGGWIIKDSYGTSWANSGYFYCSYYDAGILGETVVFPSLRTPPAAPNSSNVYAYDELGWVGNYGFSSNEAYAIVKYTILPYQASFLPQKIQRIGTYAVDDNMTIDIEVYQSFNANVLSNLLYQGSINCPNKGFYTMDLNLKADTVNSDVYIKVKYTANNGMQEPIPIEFSEAGHTSNNFSASLNSCWISSTGTNWIQTGQSTSYNFDPCIKMYTEQSVIAVIDANYQQQACIGDVLELDDQSLYAKDSSLWIINGQTFPNQPSVHYPLTITGSIDAKLIVWYGSHIDTAQHSIMVNPFPDASITQNGSTLTANQNNATYQWYHCDSLYTIIAGETSQSYTPSSNGKYAVLVTKDSCSLMSNCIEINNLFVGKSDANSIILYPNPATDDFVIELGKTYDRIEFRISNELGQEVFTKTYYTISKLEDITIQGEAGLYIIQINTNTNYIATLKLIKR
jgi:C1A family cysteine protease